MCALRSLLAFEGQYKCHVIIIITQQIFITKLNTITYYTTNTHYYNKYYVLHNKYLLLQYYVLHNKWDINCNITYYVLQTILQI